MLTELLQTAQAARDKSYVPYSNFRVGAALLTSDGHIYAGANVENASYGLTVCAERIAAFKAVNDGRLGFTDLAVAADHPGIYPCGACLQVLAKFSSELKVWVLDAVGELKPYALAELMPKAFVLK